MGRHQVSPTLAAQPAGDWPDVARRNALLLAAANILTGFALLFADPGISPAQGFLALVAPLPAWGVAYVAAAVLLASGRHLAGHSVATPLWLMYMLGAVLGLISGSTRSPGASIVLAGLVACMAGLHINGMYFRRREARARLDA